MVEPISKADAKSINKATEQIHAAAQFLAMAGKFMCDPKDDDSHTNMGWLPMKEKFITHPLGQKDKYFLVLNPAEMRMGFLDASNHIIDTFALKGKTQKEGTKWIKGKIKDFNLTSTKYKIDPHYDLPLYAQMVDKKFRKSPKKAFGAFALLRNWAEFYINKYKMQFPDPGDTRTWPHHFDHASYTPLARLKSGEVTKSISLGLAIHDGMINEPYFYISAWSKNKKLDLNKMESLGAGYWLNDAFKGAVLPIFDVLEIPEFEQQQNAIDSFFSESIEQLIGLINYKPKSVNG